jgi:thiamine-phosphate pyrophosphorylase
MFDAGLECFHVRKPKYSTPKLREYLEKINEKYRDRVVIHTHHELAVPFHLKGIHLTDRHRKKRFLQTWFNLKYIRYKRPDIQVSTSLHLINSIMRYNPEFDYVFLSPIFDSISKVGYKNTFSDVTLRDALKKTKYEVLAMGGVNYEVLEKVKEYGFKGFALLGSIWISPDPVEEFKRVLEKWQQIESTP